MVARNQLSPTDPANTGKNSSGVNASHLMSAFTYYWLIHAQYFALINMNLKLQFCAKISFSLLLIILGFSNSNICILKGAPCVSNTCATSGMLPPSSDGAATAWTVISRNILWPGTFPQIFPLQAPAQRGRRRGKRRLLQAPRQEKHQVRNLSQEKV